MNWQGKRILVIGMGEIGSSLYEIVRGVYRQTEAYDIKWGEKSLPTDVDVVHICYPYSETFIEDTVNYMKETNSLLLLIESTVLPGTTYNIASELSSKGMRTHVVHSPVRGRKADGFKACLYGYTKFIGPVEKVGGEMADDYYKSLGFKTRICRSPLETEFAKIINLSYFGIMLAWNQEMRRIAKKHNLNIDDILAFLETTTIESGFRFPRPVYDGEPIGGHCIIPGMKLLYEKYKSQLIEAAQNSNENMKRKNS